MLRLLSRALSVLMLALLIFAASRALIRALPGDPIQTLVAESGTSLSVAALQAELHLDQPYWKSLSFDVKQALHGNLGTSIISRQPIAPLLVRRLLNTLQLTFLAVLLSAALSLPLGLLAAYGEGRVGKTADALCTFFGALITAMPSPWVGPLLMILFCVWIPLFPLGDHIFLPALTLALGFSGFWARLIRERVRETLVEGAAPGARARGIPEWKIVVKYALAPSSGSLVAFFGTQFGALMAGAFVTEVIFDWPGMGSLLIDAVLKRDYPVVEAGTFVAAIAALSGNAHGDWAQKQMDPRLK